MRIYIIRHGDPDYANDTLTPRGEKEAVALVPYLEHEQIDTIYASPLGRAQRTAEYTATRLGIPIHTEQWTRELSARCVDPNNLVAWDTHPHDVRNPIYLANPTRLEAASTIPQPWLNDTVAAIRSNSDAFLAQLGYERNGSSYRVTAPNQKRIAVFCHGGFGPAWVGTLLDIPLPLMWTGFFMHTTSVTCILMEERIQGIATPRCLFYGALPHLYKEDLKPSQAGIIANYE